MNRVPVILSILRSMSPQVRVIPEVAEATAAELVKHFPPLSDEMIARTIYMWFGDE